MLKILVVEDDKNLRTIIAKNLANSGYTVTEAENGKEGFDAYCAGHFDLLILDVMMPVMDGNAVCEKIRRLGRSVPIIMLTALDLYENKEKSFSAGADDYLVKPVDMKELLLRIKALLRRYKIATESKIELPDVSLDSTGSTLTVAGQHVYLTRKEFLLLFKLLSNPDTIFTRDRLMDEIWGYDTESDDRTVDTHIKRLRERIKSDSFEIVTMRGLGYKAVLK